MGDPIRITYKGRTYKATPEALADLDKRGVAYETVADEPESSMLETAGDAARGALHGVTFGLADVPIAGESIPERLGLKSYDQVTEDSPIASAVGDVASGFVIPGGALAKLASKLGVAPKALNALLASEKGLAKVGLGAAEAAGEGALRAAAEGQDVGMTSGLSALVGGAGSTLAHGLGVGADKLKSVLQGASDKTLARSVGLLGREAHGIGKHLGGADEAPGVIANIVREVSPSTIANPKSAADRYRELDTALNTKYGPLVDSLVEQAGVPQEATKEAYSNVLRSLIGESANAPIDTTKARAYKASIDRNLSGMARMDAPSDAVGMRQLKSRYNRDAYVAPGSAIPDTAAGEAAGFQAKATDREFDRLINEYAEPEVAQAFHANNADYAKRARVRDLAEKRTEVEATDTMLPELANAIGGAVLGASVSDDSVMGGIAGAAAGGVTGATRSGFLKAQQSTKGLDRLSNIAMAGSKGAGAVSSAIDSLSSFGDSSRRVLMSKLLEDDTDAP